MMQKNAPLSDEPPSEHFPTEEYGLFSLDNKGNIRTFDKTSIKTFQRGQSDAIGHSVKLLIHPDNWGSFKRCIDDILTKTDQSSLTHTATRFRITTTNLSIQFIDANFDLLALQEPLILVRYSVVHKLIRPELADEDWDLKPVSRNGDRQGLVERVKVATNTVFWEYDYQTNTYFVDDHIIDMVGQKIEGLTDSEDALKPLIHPADIEKYEDRLARYADPEFQQKENIFRIRYLDGSWKWIRETGRVVSIEPDGTPQKLSGLIEDITDKKNEEQVLNRLYSITADTQLSLNEKLEEVLNLGNVYFGMEHGYVQKIQGDKVDLFCVSSKVKSNKNLFDAYQHLGYTALERGKVTVTNNIYEAEDPKNTENHPTTLICAPLFINNDPFGLFVFYSSKVRKSFSAREKTVLQLINQWMASEIERELNIRSLQDANHFLNTILDASPDMISVKDDNFRVIKANKEFLSLFPESVRDSIIGSTTYDYFNANRVNELIKFEKRVMIEGYGYDEQSFETADGSTRSVQLKKVKFQDANKNNYLLSVGHDTTEIEEAKQKLQVSQERYELAVEGSSVGLWDCDFKSGELFLSERYKKIMDIREKDVAISTDNFLSNVHPEDQERVKTCWEKHLAGIAPYNIEYRIKNSKNEDVWIHARGQAVWNENGVATRMAGSVDDISKRKQAEEELMRSNAELERFAYVASHDLQEPLRMVSSFTQLLKKNYADVLDEKGIQYLDIACDAAKRMQGLVRDLLTYARVGNPSEEIEEVDLNTLKQPVETNLADSLRKTDAVIEWDQLPTLTADPSRLCSVFQNLIGNALKYRKKDVPPRISVNVQSHTNKWIFTVSDNGIGMKQAYCEKIFEPFKRLHRKEEYPGTGMGLPICRKTIEGLSGKIWAVSEVGRGSIFYFTLPKVLSNTKESNSND